MGLFDKKYCDICGDKIGMLGNRRLEDGNCCKNCAKKLSPWFDERRHSTVAQIKEQLAYREQNRQAVAAFRATRTYGERSVLRIDEAQRKFMVARTSDIAAENPDVIDFTQVTNCMLDTKESRRELKQKNAEGKEVSFTPPRYEYSYDFYLVISVDSPWFDTIRFRLNRNELVLQDMTISRGSFLRQVFDPHKSVDYQRYEAMGQEIADLLLSRMPQPAAMDAAYFTAELIAKQAAAMAQAGATPEQLAQLQSAFAQMQGTMPAAPAAPQASGSWYCPSCGAQSSTGKFCEFCGTPRP